MMIIIIKYPLCLRLNLGDSLGSLNIGFMQGLNRVS